MLKNLIRQHIGINLGDMIFEGDDLYGDGASPSPDRRLKQVIPLDR